MIVMNDELFEIFELVEKVVSGDNKTAKDALRKFVMVASLIEGSEKQSSQIRDHILKLQEDIRMLSMKLDQVVHDVNSLRIGHSAVNKSIYDYYHNPSRMYDSTDVIKKF